MSSHKTEQLEQQAEQTREELADAVEELAARTDVKERLKTKARALAVQRRVQVGAAGVLTGAMAIVGVLVRRRRS